MVYRRFLFLLAFFLAGCASTGQHLGLSQQTGRVNGGPSAEKVVVDQKRPVPVKTISLKGEASSDVLVGPDQGQAIPDETSYLSQRSIYFSFDSFQIEGKYEPVILAHVHYLQSHPQELVRVIGNTDERGSRGYNLALGQKRAEIIREALTRMGISSDRVEAVSYGKEKPKAGGHDESAWAQNRRSDLLYKSLGDF